jgi:hypothetical protein
MGELRNEFSWSKSRHDCFRACRRMYYFHYYGSWGGWDRRADPRTRTLYVLKQLQTRQQWRGQTVHKCLRWVLDTLRKGGEPPAEETALQATLRRMNVDFQASGEGLYWDEPKDHCALREHEYEEEIADDVWQQLIQETAAMVSTFYQSEVFGKIRQAPREAWLELEELSSFLLAGVKVYVQLDFALREDDAIAIYDWKTGQADSASTREQLGGYILYANGRWAAPAENLVAREFNLARNEVFESRLDPGRLDEVRANIAGSAAEMKSLLDDPETNQASEPRFDLAEDEKPCRRCNFRRVCPRFQEAAS